MRKSPLLSLLLALSLMQVTSAFALNFSKFKQMVVFGDSLSDNGNSFFLSDETSPPFPPYGSTFNGTNQTFPGRWTDGRNWVDYFPLVARHFNAITPFFPDPIHGTNVAVGGSTSADLLQSQPAGFRAQIPDYLRQHDRLSGDDLYVIWIGANDFVAGFHPQETVANIRRAISVLAKAGAKDFIVISIPDISLTPSVKALGTGTVQEAKQFLTAANVLLAVELPISGWLRLLGRIPSDNKSSSDCRPVHLPIRIAQAWLFGSFVSLNRALLSIKILLSCQDFPENSFAAFIIRSRALRRPRES